MSRRPASSNQGARVTYRQLFAGSPADVRKLRLFMEPKLDVSERLRDLSDAGPQIRNALQRAERFLSLAALAGALLAAVAVAMAGRRYAIRQTDAVALMKCIGVSKNFVLGVGLVTTRINRGRGRLRRRRRRVCRPVWSCRAVVWCGRRAFARCRLQSRCDGSWAPRC